MRLLGVEVRRVLARRMVAAVVVGGLAVVVLVLVSVWSAARPPSAAEVASAEQM